MNTIVWESMSKVLHKLTDFSKVPQMFRVGMDGGDGGVPDGGDGGVPDGGDGGVLDGGDGGVPDDVLLSVRDDRGEL